MIESQNAVFLTFDNQKVNWYIVKGTTFHYCKCKEMDFSVKYFNLPC